MIVEITIELSQLFQRSVVISTLFNYRAEVEIVVIVEITIAIIDLSQLFQWSLFPSINYINFIKLSTKVEKVLIFEITIAYIALSQLFHCFMFP